MRYKLSFLLNNVESRTHWFWNHFIHTKFCKFVWISLHSRKSGVFFFSEVEFVEKSSQNWKFSGNEAEYVRRIKLIKSFEGIFIYFLVALILSRCFGIPRLMWRPYILSFVKKQVPGSCNMNPSARKLNWLTLFPWAVKITAILLLLSLQTDAVKVLVPIVSWTRFADVANLILVLWM